MAVAAVMLSCTSNETRLQERAAELCQYIPDHEFLEASRDYMTPDFYAVLDTMFYHLPEHEAMDHEWLYYFVTGNGGTIADYEVEKVEQTDKQHAVATIKVRQQWEDGSFDETSDIEYHSLYMEKVNGQWLMSDFDEHKADCIRYIENNRREQTVRDAMSDYLLREIAPYYLQGEICIPYFAIIGGEEQDSTHATLLCDAWVIWYNAAGDTLKMVSGGNHAGRMSLILQDGKPIVTAFEQTVDGAGNIESAKRIFGEYFDIYQNVHSNQNVQEALRREQMQEYLSRHNLPYRYYQDYGWEAVEIK